MSFDPAGLTGADEAEKEAQAKREEVAIGAVLAEAVMQKVAPELFGKYEWYGAMGPGPFGGKKRDLYRIRKLNGELAEPESTDIVSQPYGAPAKKKVAEPDSRKLGSMLTRKSFEWRKILHPLVGPGVFPSPDGQGFTTEVPFTPTPMRMYTDHRVLGSIVLPGVSHVSLMAATGIVGYGQRDGRPVGGKNEESAEIKEVLFERPYVVNAGLEFISGAPPEPTFATQPLYPGEVSNIVCCRSSAVARKVGPPEPVKF